MVFIEYKFNEILYKTVYLTIKIDISDNMLSLNLSQEFVNRSDGV